MTLFAGQLGAAETAALATLDVAALVTEVDAVIQGTHGGTVSAKPAAAGDAMSA